MVLKLAKTLPPVLLAVALAYFLMPRRSPGCGPFFWTPVFTFSADMPLDWMSRGELGILQSRYSARRLFIAYRFLSGEGLSDSERDHFAPAKLAAPDAKDAVTQWLESRKSVPGGAALERIGQFRMAPGGQFNYYLNCADDAFVTAKRTLQEKVARFGAESPVVSDWLQAQDRVFQNCSGDKPAFPDPAPPTAPPLVKADRTYQIAAAHFYAGKFDEAGSMFRSIALEGNSPWRHMAPYLVARSLIRKATLSAGPGEVDAVALRQAETELRRLLSDAQNESMHGAAEKMLGFVDSRLSPDQRLQRLAMTLSKPGGLDFTQNLDDYLFLFRKRTPSEQHSPDDLTGWIDSFRRQGAGARDFAFSRWEASGSTAWLVAALAKAQPPDSLAPKLLSEAARIPPTSPAYASVAFHRIRLLIASREHSLARSELDRILSRPGSTRNLFLASRMKLARSYGEFLRDAPRTPIGSELLQTETQNPPSAKQLPLFDADSVAVFNGKLPLALLREAVTGKQLPTALRRDVALAAWVRAVLLEDDAVAESLAPVVMELVPELRSGLSDYLAAKERRALAAFLILKHPGLRPWVTPGYPRGARMAGPGVISSTLSLDRIDDYRDNWWCPLAAASGEPECCIDHYRLRAVVPQPLRMLYPTGTFNSPGFLTAEQKTVAESEWMKLGSLPAAPSYLAAQVVAWAKRSPGDPRLPEALHRAVRATRYGCTDGATGKHSREAFDLLHRQYASSDWARRTPHWYK